MNITVTRHLPAAPHTVWAYLTDLAHMGELSPENVESTWLDEPGPGARFRGRNRIKWARWSSVATVTGWEPGRRFAFETSAPSSSHWAYELAEADGGTRITESMSKDDDQPLPIRVLQKLVGVRDREAHLRGGIETTLSRLEEALNPLPQRPVAPPAAR